MNVGDTVLVLSKYQGSGIVHFKEGERHRIVGFNDSFVVLDDGYAYQYDSILEQGDPRNNTIDDIEVGDLVKVVEAKDTYNPIWEGVKSKVGLEAVVTAKNHKHLALSLGGHYCPWWVIKMQSRNLKCEVSEENDIRNILKRR